MTNGIGSVCVAAAAVLGVAVLLAGMAGCGGPGGTAWQAKLAHDLPLLGHRNWIVVVDSAYPWQGSSGIETVLSDRGQVQTVQAVLDAIGQAKHVRANVYTDAELPAVAEADAPGIGAYRTELAKLLEGKNVKSLPHEEIIAKLDKAGQTFRVLIIKTDMVLPYTSVFCELDCGYWSAAAEQRLRDALKR